MTKRYGCPRCGYTPKPQRDDAKGMTHQCRPPGQVLKTVVLLELPPTDAA